jgi:hypothetical protein
MSDLRRRQFLTRRGGGVAARDERSASGQDADDRFCRLQRVGLGSLDGSVCGATARPRLDRRSQYCNRVWVGRGAQRTLRREPIGEVIAGTAVEPHLYARLAGDDPKSHRA